jgi:predicted Zn-dependent protease
MRCAFGALGVKAIETRRETGAALRVWDERGGEGLVHIDAPASRDPRDLIRLALGAARAHAGGALPRLPGPADAGEGQGGIPAPRAADPQGEPGPEGSSDERDVPGETLSGGPLEEALRGMSHRMIGGFSAAGREAVHLRSGWIEAGWTRTRIVNSLGLDRAGFRRVVSAGVVAGASIANERPGPGGPPPVRYSATRERLEEIDASTLVEEASWRAASSRGGTPVSGTQVPVVLEPRAAAAWIRSLLPHFAARPPAGVEDPPFAAAEGIDLIDDPTRLAGVRAPFIDGEGRIVRARHVVRDGVLRSGFIDSRDQDAPVEALGPMRRESFRDPPAPGPTVLCLLPGARERNDLLGGLGRGLFVTSLRTHSSPGSETFAAWVWGIWVENGRPVRPVSRTLLLVPGQGSLGRIAERASDFEIDDAGPEIGASSLIVEGAALVAV